MISILSILNLVISYYNLGTQQIPVNPWEPHGSDMLIINFKSMSTFSSLYVLMNGEKPVEFQVYSGHPNNWSYITSFKGSGYYQWRRIEVNRTSQYMALSFSGQQGMINEIVITGPGEEILDLEGAEIWLEGNNVGNVRNLVDEQRAVKFLPTSFSQTYFDEIYYVRTAEDYIEKEEGYEWTHPPLGKLLIASGILLFGFNPFGWRFMSAFFSTLMIPMIYVLGKEMFRSRTAAYVSTSLLLLDFMHFTMGRIATPETFAIFFNLASCLFFHINYRSLLDDGKPHASSIFLGLVLFALGFSTKWYTIFGLMGQLFLIFLYVLRNWRNLEKKPMTGIRLLLFKLVSILLFSLFISLAIYFSTFIPYTIIGHSFYDVYELQWKMYGYHSTLKATHPFSSTWWSWPLTIRPLWLAFNNLRRGWVSTIVAMGNPLIWWTGTFFTILAAEKAIKNKDETCIFIAVTFLFQWLPYTLMSRCLFIYHFYMNVPVLIFSITYFLNESWNDSSKRKFLMAYLIATTMIFIVFYPVISGHPIPDQYRMLLRWLPSWVF